MKADTQPAVAGPVEPPVRPSTLAAFADALNGRRGDLDAWLECNNEAEVRAHVLAMVAAEREHNALLLAELCEYLKKVLSYTENWPASFTVHDCWKRDAAAARAIIAKAA